MTLNEAKELCIAAGYEVIPKGRIKDLAAQCQQDNMAIYPRDFQVRLMENTRREMAHSLSLEILKELPIRQDPIEPNDWACAWVRYRVSLRVIL